MTLSLFHSFWTIGVLAIFIGIIVWAYSSGRKNDFEEASRLPLDDDLSNYSTDKPELK